MKKLLLASAATALTAGAALPPMRDVKIGVILGFTGPLESVTPMMADSAELAMKEVNDCRQLPRRRDADTGARGFDLHRLQRPPRPRPNVL